MTRLLGLAMLLGLLPFGVSTSSYAEASGPSTDRPRAGVERRVIGTSVAGRPIRARRLGEPGKRRVVLISTMHGNEPHTRQVLTSLRDGLPDPWHRPVGDPDLQPRRPRPALAAQRSRRRPHPQLPLRLGRPRRQLRVRLATRERTRDTRGDAVPEADRPGRD
ncbi:hypothetical protein LP418_04255 [Nocardioides sp. B-3]|nr:M14 family zinc carboxypeptidase [Nocardioides sp. B-3]UUZ60166.1 hypothetical protein LP418_04255 [Nocardioides sp. B-3]